MKTVKIILCIALWIFIIWACLYKLSQGIHEENLISQMSQCTYDEIVIRSPLAMASSLPNIR